MISAWPSLENKGLRDDSRDEVWASGRGWQLSFGTKEKETETGSKMESTASWMVDCSVLAKWTGFSIESNYPKDLVTGCGIDPTQWICDRGIWRTAISLGVAPASGVGCNFGQPSHSLQKGRMSSLCPSLNCVAMEG